MLSSPSNTRKTIKYHDIRVRIIPLTSDTTSAQYSGDIFDFVDPFSKEISLPSDSESFPINLSRIIITSDASPGTCSFSLPDPNVSLYNNPHKDGFHSSANTSNVRMPKIGDGIVIWMKMDKNNADAIAFPNADDGNGGFKIIFKGYISGTSRQISDKGSEYSYEAKDLKCRLQDQVIRKIYNNNYKTGSFPNRKEDELDAPYTNDKSTVEKILKDIMDYSVKTSFEKSWNFTYFTFASFDFNGIVELRDFIPPTMTFDNVTILEAIYRLISSAGSYRMVYDPDRDKIWFTKLSTAAKNCGNEIKLYYYVPSGYADSNKKESYSVNVMSDNTTRRTNELSNVFKAYSADIEWYSGHFYIVMGRDAIGYNKTDGRYYLPSKSWDGYNYYFGLNSIPWGSDFEGQEKPYEIVGCPLYPVWDVRGGYEPYKDASPGKMEFFYNEDGELVSKTDSSTKVSGGYFQESAEDIYEYQGFTINDRKFQKDRNFLDAVGSSSFDVATGFSYEAWIPYGICPYCAGSGAVEDNNRGDWNGFGKTRKLSGEVDVNWAPTGLTPFNYGYKEVESSHKGFTADKMELIPTRHPVPWKNMCPVCKGTGMEPWFKMTTLLTSLIDLSPDQVRMDENAKSIEEKAKDKTWAEIVQDKAYRYPLSVHIETTTSVSAYEKPCQAPVEGETLDFIEHSLVGVKSIQNPNYFIFKTQADPSGEPVDESEAYIETLYYTSIMNGGGFSIDVDRGLIVFKEAQFINCKKPMKNILKTNHLGASVFCVKQTTYEGGPTNSTAYRNRGMMGGTGQRVKAFWRPARAWITCYFKRDMFATFLARQNGSDYKVTGLFNKSSEYTLKKVIKGDDGFSTYKVSARVEDNRYCAEIKKYSETGSMGEEFTSRPIVNGMTMESFKWQIHPWDMGRWNVPASNEDQIDMVVPTDYNDIWTDVKDTMIRQGYIFPFGKFHTTERIREEEAKSLGKSGEDLSNVLRSDMRGKILTWVHKDDRQKLLERGTAELERRNDIQVSGTVKIRGEIPDFERGLGWVTLIDGVKAVVVKEELDFGNGFTVSLEVGTEELRVGQMRERDLDYQRMEAMKLEYLNLAKGDHLVGQRNDSNANGANVKYMPGGGVEG
jgi:hypothetical protein|nr:MAG TPA: antitermination protein [Caudoviricetes sp.]